MLFVLHASKSNNYWPKFDIYGYYMVIIENIDAFFSIIIIICYIILYIYIWGIVMVTVDAIPLLDVGHTKEQI